ncbi:methylated-DNA--[protein]-cysteine S-methyltransferase [Tessaracoccus lubricantis]|uniref:Methylated-DNA--protein-cysteine methyltransferase n=1 Tax=Tessaracoccus lubricantis TaxID=545543 RepID=A0ABP9FBL1_9ACTN
MTTHSIMDSPIGPLTIIERDGALAAIYMTEHKHAPAPETFGERVDDALPEVTRQLHQYFDGERTDFDLPLNPVGTEFQKSVWDEMAAIPYGQTLTYGDIAAALGRPTASRAVGAAVGRNPISIVVPCHRVVGHSGKLIGYAGGADRKEYLLAHERGANPAELRSRG